MPQPAGWGDYSVEQQHDAPESMLALYRSVLRARRACLDPDAGLEWPTSTHPDVLMFHRGDVTVVVNVGADEVMMADVCASAPRLASSRLLLSSSAEHDDPTRLPGNTCCWFASS